jgi:putative peptide zinc metalloprotease protein
MAAALLLSTGVAGASVLNKAEAVTSGAGPRTQSKAAFDVGNVDRPLVVSSNSAIARSNNCTGCRSEAVAFDVLVYAGNPWSVHVSNTALATQVRCNLCATVAYATQLVVGGPGVKLDLSGKAALKALKADAQAAMSAYDGADLVAALDAITAQAIDVINAHVSVAGPQARVAGPSLAGVSGGPGYQIATYRQVDTDPAS